MEGNWTSSEEREREREEYIEKMRIRYTKIWEYKTMKQTKLELDEKISYSFSKKELV